jgi:isopenicillin N synthase-like dioxygenase
MAAVGGDPALVDGAFARPGALSTLRFNFYPESGGPVGVSRDGTALACEAHVDSGFLTLLHQDQRGGLQLRGRDRRWRDIEPDADAFVVNTGLALEQMTGGTLPATRHRVRHQPRRRISVPFFLEPSPEFAVDALSLALPFPAAEQPVVYEEFLATSLAKFAEYDRSPAPG